jgi:Tol biopolymer transport system component
MNQSRDLLERAGNAFPFPDEAFERLAHRRDRRSRNRRLGAFAIVAAIGVAAALVGAGVLATEDDRTFGDEKPQPAPIAPSKSDFFVDVRNGATTPLPSSLEDAYFLVVSPDGTRVAYSPCCTTPVAGFVANVDGTGVREVTSPLVDAYGPRWSPDGSSIVYQGRDAASYGVGDIFVLDLATGTSRQVTDLGQQQHQWWFLSPSFAPNGRSIIFHRPREQGPLVWDLWSVPATGGEASLVRRNAGFGVYSPDGGSIAYLSPIGSDFTGAELMVVGAGGGTPRALVQRNGIRWPRWSPDGTRIAYGRRGHIFVVDVSTGRSERVANGGVPEWFDDQTLIVGQA